MRIAIAERADLGGGPHEAPAIPFVPNVSIPADHYQLYNLQSALVLGPLSFQAEWSTTRVEQIGGGR